MHEVGISDGLQMGHESRIIVKLNRRKNTLVLSTTYDLNLILGKSKKQGSRRKTTSGRMLVT